MSWHNPAEHEPEKDAATALRQQNAQRLMERLRSEGIRHTYKDGILIVESKATREGEGDSK